MTLYELPFDPGSYRQEVMIPSDRRHLYLEVAMLGPVDHLVVTLRVRDGVPGELVQLATFSVPAEEAGYLALASLLHAELLYHRAQLSPF